jgi:hypothetical protein
MKWTYLFVTQDMSNGFDKKVKRAVQPTHPQFAVRRGVSFQCLYKDGLTISNKPTRPLHERKLLSGLKE